MAARKSKLSDIRYLGITSLLLLLAMFMLPFYSVDSYSIVKNTTSHLGAQNAPNAWMMNITFILLGLSCLLEAWLHLGKWWFHKIILSTFGLSLIFIGIFQHAPIIEGVPFSLTEDRLHSVFASITGFTFTVFAISVAFVENKAILRALAVMVGVAATILSMMMFLLPQYSGIWQRIIFLVSFCWLTFMIERARTWEEKPIAIKQR